PAPLEAAPRGLRRPAHNGLHPPAAALRQLKLDFIARQRLERARCELLFETRGYCLARERVQLACVACRHEQTEVLAAGALCNFDRCENAHQVLLSRIS